MEGKELIAQIRTDVQTAQSAGKAFLVTSAVDAYLAKLEETIVLSPEEQSRLHQKYIAQFTAENAAALESFKATITAGQGALKSALLINGGATAALLSLIGAGWSKGASAVVLAQLPLSLAFFAFGVLSAAVAGGATYLSQEMYSSGQARPASWAKGLAIATGIGAYLLFAFGILAAYRALVGV